MPTEVIMPELGESVDEATITRWLKSEGDTVKEFEPLVEVNTDKVDTEIPSPTSGVILKILISANEVVQAGQILCWIGEPGEAAPDEDGVAVSMGRASSGEEEPALGAAVLATESVPALPAPRPGRDRKLGFISPVVARMSGEHNLDLAQVKGTGRGGRITKEDVLAYLESRPAEPAAPQPEPVRAPAEAITPRAIPPTPPPAAIPGEILRLTPIRRAIADHMVFSKHTSPHVTSVMEADLSRVVAHRQANKSLFARDGVKLTFTAYFISAMVMGAKAYPIANASWSDEGVVLHKEINIGMATSLGEDGLIVPVIKNADSLSLLGIARAVNDLANRARSRQLRPDEVKGGTITLTNHGTSGSLFAAPIINQPQCAIMGTGVIQKRVIVIDDAIAIRPMVYISLTFDHRILDGAFADYFLGKVVETLENWS